MTLISQRASSKPPVWGNSETEKLRHGLLAIGLQTSDDQVLQLEAFARLLLKWNRTYNLLGATSIQALIEDHLLDALAAAPVLRKWLSNQDAITGQRLLDIGSGAGLPGVVLAILMPDVQVTLVEPIGKKIAFLRQAIAECRLPTTQAVEAKIENLVQDPTSAYGMLVARNADNTPHFICRAFSSLERFAALCAPHAHPESLLFAMKAARVDQELADLTSGREVLAVEPLCTPYAAGRQRNLVVLRPARPIGTRRPPAFHSTTGGSASPSSSTTSETSLH